jgi:hypothetical protein
MGRAAVGVAGGADPGQQLPAPDPLAEADQVVLVVGVVVGGATAVAQPQADPAAATIDVAEPGDVAAGHRDQGGAGGGEQVDAVVAAAAAVAGGAPALADPHRSLDRAHPTTGTATGRCGTGKRGGQVALVELVDQWPQPTQLGGGQHGQDGDHHQHRQPATRGGTARRPGHHGRPPDVRWTAATAAAGSRGPPVPRHSGQRR